MNYKKQIGIILIVCLVFIIIAIHLATICPYNDSVCINRNDPIAEPLLMFSLSVLISSLVLFLSREQAFKAWRKFAYWAIPIGAILLWLAPTDTPGGLGISFFSLTKESASWFVSGIFLIVSLGIIIRNRRTLTK